MTVECKHDWANSYSINKHGTLNSVLECNKCGKRVNESRSGGKKLPHLKNVSDEAYASLTKMFTPRFQGTSVSNNSCLLSDGVIDLDVCDA